MTKAEIIAELRRVATSEYEDAYDAAEGAFGAGLDFREPSLEISRRRSALIDLLYDTRKNT